MRHRPKPIPWEKAVGRGGRRASDRAKKRAYRFRVRPSEREDYVVRHPSAPAPAKTDEACREAEM